MTSTLRTPLDSLSNVGTLSSEQPPPTLSYTHSHPLSANHGVHSPHPPHHQQQPRLHAPSRFSTRRFPSQAASSASQAGHGSKLAKKASKPFLGWFARKLRKSIGASMPGAEEQRACAGDGQQQAPPQRGVHARRRSSWGGGGALIGGAADSGEHGSPPAVVELESGSGSGGQSEYGRLVSNNGLRYLRAGADYNRLRRTMSEVSEGDRASSLAARTAAGADDDGGYQSSVATSLDPFPPSVHHRASTRRHRSISSSRWTPSSFTANSSSSTLDDDSTTASVSLRHAPYRGRALSEARSDLPSRSSSPETAGGDGDVDGSEGAFEDNASLRPIPPSVPPSPNPSTYARTVAPSVASSRSQSYAASLAPSSRGWRSIATSATPTTAVTSVDGASVSTGRAESIIIHPGPMAHIAQPPTSSPTPAVSAAELPVAGPSALSASSSAAASPLRTHGRHDSWTSASFTPVLEQAPSAGPSHPSSPLASPSPSGGRPRAPSSPTAPTGGTPGLGPSRWGAPASPPPPLPRSATTAAAGQRELSSWSATVRPPSLLSHALATSALAGPSHRPDSAGSGTPNGLEPAAAVIPLQTLGPPSFHPVRPTSPITSSHFDPHAPPLHGQHPYPPTYTTPHVRNNPVPSAPPNDNASLLTLASSSFFAFPPTGTSLANGNGSILTGGGSIWNGNPGRGGAPSIVSASIRRGVDRAESVSFSFGGPGHVQGGGGGGGGGGTTGSRRQADDTGASVRAVRRKGSWESGESRWSAAAVGVAPSSASIVGRGYVRGGGERDSTVGLWGGPAWGGNGGGGGGGAGPSYRQGSILTVDVDDRLKDGARSVSFSFRSGGDTDDADEDEHGDAGEDGGSSRMSRRRRRSSSLRSSDRSSSRSSSRSRFGPDDDDDDIDGPPRDQPTDGEANRPPHTLPMDANDYRRRELSVEDEASPESGTEEEACTPGPLERLEPSLGKPARGILA